MGEGRRVLNSFLQGKKERFYIPLVGNHALEIQRWSASQEAKCSCIYMSREMSGSMCCSPRAALPGQLPGQLKSLQTGTWNGPQIKSTLVCHLFLCRLLFSFFMSQKQCFALLMWTTPGRWPMNHSNDMLILDEFIMINREQFEKLKFRIWSKAKNHTMLV